MKAKLPYQMRKKQSIALILFAVFILVFRLGFQYFKNSQKEEEIAINFVNSEKPNSEIILVEFNPNDLDENAWIQLGFTQKQSKTILKYKEIIGGAYLSKEQFKKCYAVSDEKYELLQPYILLPETTKEAKQQQYQGNKFAKKELNVKGKFNPDNYHLQDWIQLGFTENQANAILKYKNYLGGSFISKEKFKACFIISEENYKKLAPYLLLPEKTPQDIATSKFEKPKIQYRNFDPNALPLEGWVELGFSQKQAEVIMNYKNRNLKGSFKNLEDIKNCFVISEKKFEELKPYIKLQEIEATQKINTEKAKVEETNFRNVDLNKITFAQLIEFGFDEKSAGSYLGFRKKLGGFVEKHQILDTYNLDKDLAEKLTNICYLDNSSIPKYSLVGAPEAWLKNHPYFRSYADKIIFYRISYPDEKKIWKYLKLKPEQEAKMKLYLK